MKKLVMLGVDDRVEAIDLEEEPLKRGNHVSRGGQGKVYAARDRTGCVAKIYDERDDGRQRRKLVAMLEAPPAEANVVVKGNGVDLLAWPTHLLLHEDRSFAGFLMPRVPSDFEFLSLWFRRGDHVAVNDPRAPLTPEDRSLPSRVAGCRNLARLVQSVHALGHQVIDMNAPNIFVQRRTMRVCLIDCDSFSIAVDGRPVHVDTAVKPESLAPEYHAFTDNKPSFEGDAQDRFALALAIFQWLNHGIHPFQGKPVNDDEPMYTIQQNLRAWRYAYGVTPHPELLPKAGSDHDLFPTHLRQMFDRAFDQRQPADRPSAAEWVERLGALRAVKGFQRCERAPDDPLHIHFRDMPCAWCRFENGRRQAPPGIPNGHPASASQEDAVTGSQPLVASAPGYTAARAPMAVVPPPGRPRNKWIAVALVLLALSIGVRWIYGKWPWQYLGGEGQTLGAATTEAVPSVETVASNRTSSEPVPLV